LEELEVLKKEAKKKHRQKESATQDNEKFSLAKSHLFYPPSLRYQFFWPLNHIV
jgi:hypothetical protein